MKKRALFSSVLHTFGMPLNAKNKAPVRCFAGFDNFVLCPGRRDKALSEATECLVVGRIRLERGRE